MSLLELHYNVGVVFLKLLVSSLEFLIPLLKSFNLLPLAFTRRLGSATVAKNSLHTTLFFFIISLSSFSRGKTCLGLGKDLAPRLPLLGGLLFRSGGW